MHKTATAGIGPSDPGSGAVPPAPDPSARPAAGAGPAAAPTPWTEPEVLAVIRDRRRHYEEVYFQQESRAQFLATLQLAAASPLIVAVADHSRAFGKVSNVVLTCLAAPPLLFAFVLTASMFVPLKGRRLFGRTVDPKDAGAWSRLADRAERVVNWFGFDRKRRDQYVSVPRPEVGRLRTFVEKVVLQAEGALGPLDLDAPSLVKSECYNVWAQWYVAERKAGILRLATTVTAIGLALTACAYVRVHWTIQDLNEADRQEVARQATQAAEEARDAQKAELDGALQVAKTVGCARP